MMEEAWKTTGNCENCRRKPYCKKSCTKHKEFVQNRVWETMREKYGDEVLSSLDRAAFFAGLLGAIADGNVHCTDDGIPVAE